MSLVRWHVCSIFRKYVHCRKFYLSLQEVLEEERGGCSKQCLKQDKLNNHTIKSYEKMSYKRSNRKTRKVHRRHPRKREKGAR